MTKEQELNILLENLSVFGRRNHIADEARKLTLEHIVSLLCADESASPEELADKLRSLVPDLSGGEEIILYNKMQGSSALLRKMRESFAIGNTEDTAAGTHGRIACVKNPVNNRALELFSQRLSNAKAEFATSFSEACEAVADGNCEFCILPIENTIDGKMSGFYSMIDRYELKICAIADIEDERYEWVRYALLGRCCHEPSEHSKNTNVIFEFSVTDQSGSFMGRLISATEACGAVVVSIGSYPVIYDSNLSRYLFAISVSGTHLLSLRGFLANNYINYTPIGFYQSISQ